MTPFRSRRALARLTYGTRPSSQAALFYKCPERTTYVGYNIQ